MPHLQVSIFSFSKEIRKYKNYPYFTVNSVGNRVQVFSAIIYLLHYAAGVSGWILCRFSFKKEFMLL